MTELKSQEQLNKIIDFYGGDILGLDTSFVEDETIKGFSSVDLIPVIQLHSDIRNIKGLFYTALGKAITKAKQVGSRSIFVLCNNPDLSEQLKKREGFRELGFTILTKKV